MSLITAILKRPSQRTLMEANLAGLTVILITSIITPSYIIFFTESALWLKIITGIGGFGLFIMMFSNLATSYLQYYSFKMSMGLYPINARLLLKLEEARQIRRELKELIEDSELNQKEEVKC